MFFFDDTMILLIPAFALALYAQFKVKSTYKKYAQVPSAWGRPGVVVAQDIMHNNQLYDVDLEEGEGVLSDHYDPRSKKVVLSPDNYRGTSIASLSVAAHEVGHAIQHKVGFAALQWRHSLLPAANIGSTMAFPLFFLGWFMSSFSFLMDVGIILFSAVVIFQLITLPVEFNASSRAIAILKTGGYLTPKEIPMAKKVLNAAALTYVAATAVSLIHLLRMFLMSRD